MTYPQSGRPTRRIAGTGLLTICAIVAAAGSTAFGDEGRTAISVPTTITQSGSYILTADVAPAGGSPAITIAAPRVSLDLNGHSVTGSGLSSPYSIYIDAGAEDVWIENGTIFGNTVGVYAPQPLRSLHVDRVAFKIQTRGIQTAATRFVEVTRSIFRPDSAGPSACIGLQLANPSDPLGSLRISDNTFVECSLQTSSAFAGQVRSNNLSGDPSDISLVAGSLGQAEGFLVLGNTIAGSSGISAQPPHTAVRLNTIRADSNPGIQLLHDGDLVRENVFRGDGPTGIQALGARALIDGNVSESHSLCGIDFRAVGGAYRGNMLRNNAGGAVCFNAGGSATDAGGNIP